MPVNRAASDTKIASAPIPWTSTEALSQPVAGAAGGDAGADLSFRPAADGPRDVCGRRGLPGIGYPIPSANVEASGNMPGTPLFVSTAEVLARGQRALAGHGPMPAVALFASRQQDGLRPGRGGAGRPGRPRSAPPRWRAARGAVWP